METMTLKALSERILQGNRSGNPLETKSFLKGNQEGNGELDRLQIEYFRLLSQWWELDDDPEATMDKARMILARLDELYHELYRQGRKVPIRLPVEKGKAA